MTRGYRLSLLVGLFVAVGGSPAVTTAGATAALAGSQLTLTATPAFPLAGQTVSLHGTLTLSGSGSVAGASVDVTEVRPDFTTTDLGLTTVKSDGTFGVTTEALSQVGGYTFTATWAGDARHTGSQAWVIVAVRQATSTTLAPSATTVTYGQAVTLTAHLTGAPGGVVTINRNAGGVVSVAVSGPVDADGNLAFTGHPGRNESFWATYGGDANHAPSKSGVHAVTVKPILSTSLSGWYGTSGGYRLYHYHSSCASAGTGCPVYTIKFTPSNPGHIVYAVTQIATSSGWKDAAKLQGTLGPKSTAAIRLRYYSTSVIGHNTRIQAVFTAGPKFGGTVSGFSYFRITR